MYRKRPLDSSSDSDMLQDRVHELEHRLSVIGASIVVLFALIVAAAALAYPVFVSKKAEWEDAINAKQVYPAHIVEDIGNVAMKSINQFRSDRELSLVKDVPDDAREIVAAWTGCAINRYSLESWETEDCAALIPYGDGYAVNMDFYEWDAVNEGEGELTADEGAPTPSEILAKIKEDFNDSRSEEDSEVSAPHVLNKDARMSKMYVVGSGGEKWQVYIFSIQKKE